MHFWKHFFRLNTVLVRWKPSLSQTNTSLKKTINLLSQDYRLLNKQTFKLRRLQSFTKKDLSSFRHNCFNVGRRLIWNAAKIYMQVIALQILFSLALLKQDVWKIKHDSYHSLTSDIGFNICKLNLSLQLESAESLGNVSNSKLLHNEDACLIIYTWQNTNAYDHTCSWKYEI